MQPFLIHNHTEFSNFRLLDSINKTEDLLEESLKLGLKGIVITDHETTSSHIKAYQHYTKNKERFKDFKLGFGNEIYLIKEEDGIKAQEENARIKYNHFVLVAKNEKGHEGIRKLSTIAWDNSYYRRNMQRVPLYYNQLKEVMKEYKGTIIGSTACLGGIIPQLLFVSNGIDDWAIQSGSKPRDISKEEMEMARVELDKTIKFFLEVFGEDFYIEIQPSNREVQNIANQLLLNLSREYNIKPIVTTDTHYLNKDKAELHQAYLQSKNGDREVAEFYSHTYLMNYEEMSKYISKDILDELIKNTHEIMNKIEDIEFGRKIQIPKAHIPNDFSKEYVKFYKKYPQYKFINKLLESENEQNQYYLYLIYNGYKEKYNKISQKWNVESVLNRVNLEIEQIILLSEYFGQPMSGYFLFVKELVDIIWEISLVAPNRGSAAAWITNYLIDITQINPLDFDLPYWRFLHIERGAELPDVDLDVQGDKKEEVIDRIRQEYGYDKVLQLSTYMTEGLSSSILTACRSMGIDSVVAQNISNSLSDEGSLRDQLYGNKEKEIKVNSKLKGLIKQYDGLEESALEFEGLVSGRSAHAGGIVVFNDGIIKESNAMMKTTKGIDITQYDAGETEFLGGMKIDVLATEALTRLRTAFDLLVKDGLIEWEGNLKVTYNKHFHPDILDYDSEEMYEMLYNGDVISVFQFNTPVGEQAIRKVKAKSFENLSTANALMRLTVEDGEQPTDKYVKFKNDINLWYKEMEDYGLNKNEMEILISILSNTSGICSTQESLMRLLMDKRISNYPLKRANRFRKMATKSKREELEKEELPFFSEQSRKNNLSEEFIRYVWNECFVPQMQYSFAEPHIVGYTVIAIQEMNLVYRFSPLYWQTACLIVDSGGLDADGGNNYGKISKAANTLKEVVVAPDINKSDLTFTPDKNSNTILFGLKPIQGLRKDMLYKIIENRPYKSLDDFIEKTDATINQTNILIKSGAFNKLCNSNARDIMIYFVDNYATNKRDKLTMSNFEEVYLRLLDKDKFKDFYELYLFRKALKSKSKKNIKFDEVFLEKYSRDVSYDYGKDGRVIIDNKEFEKYYDNKMDYIRDNVLNNKEIIDQYNNLAKRDYWKENCLGLIESWEMETISFYPGHHEFDYIPINKYFPIQDYNNIENNQKGVIAGTVVDKNKNKSTVYVFTKFGVVAVKMWKNVFYEYDEVITNGKKGKNRVVYDDSWFERGTKLVLVGRKNGVIFQLDNRGTQFSNSIYKINNFDSESVFYTSKRYKEV